MQHDDADRSSDELTFEGAIARLEEVARELERPDTALDDAVRLYEEGMKLARYCTEQLEQAELRMAELSPEAPSPDDASDDG